jgi:hypothetical protein
MARRIAITWAALALAGIAGAPTATAAEMTRLGAGNWTYFSDPRAVSTRTAVYTGWITPAGRVVVAKFVPSTGRRHTVVVGRTGPDDHNNPALVLRPDGRLMVFFSPHSGRYEPKNQVSRMYYRVAARSNSIARWGPTRHLPVNARGRLGYTYPNPLALSHGRLFLAWRGGGWLPTYSVHQQGRWLPAREIVRGSRGHRPYAKYASGPAGSDVVHMAFTEGHPESNATNVRYLQYRLGVGFTAADGRRAGSLGSLPMHVSRAEIAHRYNARTGRSWVMDVADDGHGNPVIVYSVGFGRARQAFRYARWTGEAWLDRPIAPAYGTVRRKTTGAFQTGGIVLDPRDPSTVYVSRVATRLARIEEWHTPDGGVTWTRVRGLSPAGRNCFRPAVPRGSARVLLFVCGRVSHWQQYATTINAVER